MKRPRTTVERHPHHKHLNDVGPRAVFQCIAVQDDFRDYPVGAYIRYVSVTKNKDTTKVGDFVVKFVVIDVVADTVTKYNGYVSRVPNYVCGRPFKFVSAEKA